MGKASVAVRIAGQEYRIRSDADEAWLQNVARVVDETMLRIRERTGTVDTLDVAVLTALNLARELMSLRETLGEDTGAEPDRVHALIELAEAALRDAGGGPVAQS